MAIWWEKFNDKEVGVSDLWPVAIDSAALDLGDKGDRSQKTALGKKLAFARDRTYSVGAETKQQLRVERAGTVNRAAQWRLRLMDERPANGNEHQ